jgi:thiol-disulfide isomerase/thioredoxin
MRSLAFIVLMAVAAVVAPAAKSAELPYDHSAFDAALAAGQPVAVVFHANWCPTCRAQAPVLKQLLLEPKYKQLTLFIADFDTEMALRKRLGVTQQSTIVVFNKGHELVRSTGDTQHDALAALLSTARS